MENSTKLGMVVAAIALSVAGCQEITCKDHATCSSIAQERGGNSPSTLNPPITATVTDPNVQVNSATGDQTRELAR